jgi:hypothetical protein
VDLHQGQITVQSELGKGTAFSFTLPVYDPATAFAQSLQDSKSIEGADTQGISVILVNFADVERKLSALPSAKLEEALKEGEEAIRKRLSRNDRVLSLQRSLIAILAVADAAGTEAIAQRMQKVCDEWAAKAVGKQGPAAVTLATGHFPQDGTEPEALLQTVRAKLAGGSHG